MFRRKFLTSLAGIAGCLPFIRSSAKADSLLSVPSSPSGDALILNPLYGMPEDKFWVFGSPGEELDGLSPQAAFSLGVEWKMFWNSLCENPGDFLFLIHPINVNRCLDLATREYNRSAKLSAPGVHSWAAPYERDWRVIEVGHCPFRRRPT